ncbi:MULTISPECIES: ESX-1 secretion-associated protein [Mycobacteriaceae]|uniref:ESX-1 secretion-associated protein n=1 Tax=Mycolicibacterium mucogenicum DSM 44124 TaxID=1226753 RepID=A0A8H2JH86_MYCMU|nr:MULTISPECIES: ESX-1 secretion-associated protein [Mycobacteriaceae]KAB7760975.1 hypothetical protein MMUC44124_05000 [Mycolicibacterium mucogenicum DSM 44124]QPG69239.1 ESX-1 secretion-associated protein [Mycolicibacterium mucogenicum DSM 44124]
MASDHEKNLVVLTEHLLHLAEKQRKASDQIAGSTRSLVDPARQVSDTHGIACEATHLAVSAAISARRAGGKQMQKVSNELDLKLTDASAYYGNADAAGAQMLNHQMPR